MKKQPRKSNLTPEAAKLLEQYRNAGKTGTNSETGVDNDENATNKPVAPPPSQVQRRSGTRGK